MPPSFLQLQTQIFLTKSIDLKFKCPQKIISCVRIVTYSP